jgi:hypothetical protein
VWAGGRGGWQCVGAPLLQVQVQANRNSIISAGMSHIRHSLQGIVAHGLVQHV